MSRIKSLFRFLAFWTWLIVIALLIGILIPHLLNFLFPDYPVLAKWIVLFDWRLAVIACLGLLTIGTSLLWLSGFPHVYLPWFDGKGVFVTFLITAFWLAYYFSLSFSFFSRKRGISLLGLTFFFLLWLPNWSAFLAFFKFSDLVRWLTNLDLEDLRKNSWKAVLASPKILLVLLKRMAILVLLLAIVGVGAVEVNRYRKHQQLKMSRLALDPLVNDYQPKVVVGNTKVVIYGDKFGLQQGSQNFLWDATYQRVIPAELWTNQKIIFPVPLDWKLGNHLLYVRRIMFWPEGGRIVTAESKPIILKVVNRQLEKGRGWPSFLDQIPTLNPEVRRLNGF